MDHCCVIVGFRRTSGVQRLRSLPSSLVPQIRPFHSEINGQDRFVLLIPLLLHRISSLGLAKALVPEPRRHVSIEGGSHAGTLTHIPTQRPLTLIRIAGCQDATWQHQRPPGDEEGTVPVDSAAAAGDGSSSDAAALVPAVTGDVLPAGEPRQQGLVLGVFEILQEAVR